METKSVNYTGLIALMIEATKALQQENYLLNTDLELLKEQQDEILEKMQELEVHTGYGVHGSSFGHWAMIITMMMGFGIMILVLRRSTR